MMSRFHYDLLVLGSYKIIFGWGLGSVVQSISSAFFNKLLFCLPLEMSI